MKNQNMATNLRSPCRVPRDEATLSRCCIVAVPLFKPSPYHDPCYCRIMVVFVLSCRCMLLVPCRNGWECHCHATEFLGKTTIKYHRWCSDPPPARRHVRLVLGNRKKMNMVITTIKPPNSKKMPYLRWQSDTRKHCATKAVKNMLTQTTILCPADLVSNGNISLGTSHPSGPHDLPYPRTKRLITTTRKMPIPFGSSSPCPNFRASVTATAICKDHKHQIISIPASKKKNLLPNLSTKAIDINVARTRAPVVMVEDQSIPKAPITNCGRFFLCSSVENGEKELTWFPNPMPTPRKHRPMISMAIFCAKAFRIAPTKKLIAPKRMLALLPLFRVTWDAANVERRAAK
ncbi:hypothetical protein Ccrd_010009 [Cynara cardunculus var. scolymus]|uniref:Uncharacterized protein n=1 Tax=Cynara cardunculus var. scolymus TaxID=59895 RepID=A0A103YM34_CYNCS|nr:hypothetical protein Ccrd_010009 [Cynara cardunculus var. scolymus]